MHIQGKLKCRNHIDLCWKKGIDIFSYVSIAKTSIMLKFKKSSLVFQKSGLFDVSHGHLSVLVCHENNAGTNDAYVCMCVGA